MLSSAAAAPAAAPRGPPRPLLPPFSSRKSVSKKAPKPRRDLPHPQALPLTASSAAVSPLTAAAAAAASSSQQPFAVVAAAALAETCVASALAALAWKLLLRAQSREDDEDEVAGPLAIAVDVSDNPEASGDNPLQ